MPSSPQTASELERAHILLANLGFLLVPGPPLDHGAAYLLVALRPHPTRTHFDPERIEYWGRNSGKPARMELAWPLVEGRDSFSWGSIRVTDRVNAENTFVAFGGSVSSSRDGQVHAALFRSEAPILRMAGRSGPADPLAVQVAAFLARLRGAAGYDSPVCGLAQSLTPTALYAAFVNQALDKGAMSPAADSISSHILSLLRSERRRLELDETANAAAGNELARLIKQRST